MNFEDGSCQWEDMEDSFEISRHALQIHTPMRRNGDIDCANANGDREYARLDYSKGFPDWWHLDRTDVKVPSEHTQEGKRYAAEISLAHFYELDHYKNQIGYVTMFMQDYPNEKPWNYLDKLICKWRREEEKQRKKCGLPPAPVYKMCELYRGQERTQEDLEFPEEQDTSFIRPQTSQLERPSPVPLKNFGKPPDAKRFPLQLCEGHCTLTEDCALGLVCKSHRANEPVSGCLGGEKMKGDLSFCIFDPFGVGYKSQDNPPTAPPTKTASPTITPLPPKPIVDFGGTPPDSAMPLQRCQGDCDTDDDCADGLKCFQRTSKQAIPGCIGGEENVMVTDYCILDLTGDGFVDKVTTSPTIKPTMKATVATKAPTNNPTAVPTNPPVPFVPRPSGPKKEIWNRGWEPKFLLGECEGDCDNDDDCLPGLICFSRDTAGVEVPGCLGGEDDRTLTDYCSYPPLPPLEVTEGSGAIIRKIATLPPTVSPTKQPTKSPTEAPVEKDSRIPLNGISWSPPRNVKLGLCAGDCDTDADCEDGLYCYQRFTPNVEVPGCIGGDSEKSLMDFCAVDNRDKSEKPEVVIPVVVIAPPAPAPTELNRNVPDSIPDIVSVPDISSSTQQGIPPPIDCQMYKDLGVKMDRFCDNDHRDFCCQSPRSSSNFCHENYDRFGDAIRSACHHCCLEERNEAYIVGLKPQEKPGLEVYTSKMCADNVDNTARICKPESCCDPLFSDTRYCRQEKAKHGDDWERICWYCCHPSKAHPVSSRKLDANDPSTMSEAELRIWHRENPRELGPKDVKFNHSHMQREMIVREENFVEKGLKDEDAYFQEMHGEFQRRELQTSVKENYEDVHWWPYEWLLKVGTEYYFRYEGSMTVPPCYSVNHWRVMKDPIRVAKHQITELERLTAWRINGQCQADTAGKKRKDNPDAVDVNRPVQELEKGHRMVFCECQDWPSKFPAERAWCQKWQQRDPELRLFQNPYNWNQGGF